MAKATLPPPVDISAETKKAIIDGLKKVLDLYKHAGVLDHGLSYGDVIHDPATLQAFINAYTSNREMADPVVISAEGGPVRDEETALSCGITLGQIQQLLVKTCAKHHFDKAAEAVVTETVTKKTFLFFTRTEEVQKVQADPVEERKAREILRYLAFGWQLPLLDTYRSELSQQHLIELGEDLVVLAGEEQIRACGQLDPAVLKKAKATAGEDFAELIAERPEAVPGVAAWNREMYDFYRKMLGHAAWAFFSREKAFFNVVAALDKATAKCYGDVLCSIAAENLEEIQRLNIDKTEVLVESLRTALGPKVHTVLGIPSFSKDVLRKLVDSLLHMSGEREQLRMTIQLTCKAIVPNIIEWLGRQKIAAPS